MMHSVSRSPSRGGWPSSPAPPPTGSLHSQTRHRQEDPREDPQQAFVDTHGKCRLETKGKFHQEKRTFRVSKELKSRKETGGVFGAVVGTGDQIIQVRRRTVLGGSPEDRQRIPKLKKRSRDQLKSLSCSMDACPSVCPQETTGDSRAEGKNKNDKSCHLEALSGRDRQSNPKSKLQMKRETIKTNMQDTIRFRKPLLLAKGFLRQQEPLAMER